MTIRNREIETQQKKCQRNQLLQLDNWILRADCDDPLEYDISVRVEFSTKPTTTSAATAAAAAAEKSAVRQWKEIADLNDLYVSIRTLQSVSSSLSLHHFFHLRNRWTTSSRCFLCYFFWFGLVWFSFLFLNVIIFRVDDFVML